MFVVAKWQTTLHTFLHNARKDKEKPKFNTFQAALWGEKCNMTPTTTTRATNEWKESVNLCQEKAAKHQIVNVSKFSRGHATIETCLFCFALHQPSVIPCLLNACYTSDLQPFNILNFTLELGTIRHCIEIAVIFCKFIVIGVWVWAWQTNARRMIRSWNGDDKWKISRLNGRSISIQILCRLTLAIANEMTIYWQTVENGRCEATSEWNANEIL